MQPRLGIGEREELPDRSVIAGRGERGDAVDERQRLGVVRDCRLRRAGDPERLPGEPLDQYSQTQWSTSFSGSKYDAKPRRARAGTPCRRRNSPCSLSRSGVTSALYAGAQKRYTSICTACASTARSSGSASTCASNGPSVVKTPGSL